VRRVQQHRNHQDEIPEHILIAGSEECCQTAHRAQVGLRHPPIAIDLGLLDLQVGKGLVRLVALGDELRPIPTLIGGKLHGGIGAAALGCCLDAASI
jgi:hypothetical protein